MEAKQADMEVTKALETLRLIARFDIKGDRLKRTRSMEGLRDVSELSEAVSRTAHKVNVEFLFNNFTASLYNQGIMSLDLLKSIKDQIRLPIIYEGGVQSTHDVDRLFQSGADRVVVNSALFENPDLLSNLISTFGSSAILVNVTARKNGDTYSVFSKMGRELQNFKFTSWLEKIAQFPNVELILTDIESEGSQRGFSPELLSIACNYYPTELIIPSGGLANAAQMDQLLKSHRVTSFASATFFREIA